MAAGRHSPVAVRQLRRTRSRPKSLHRRRWWRPLLVAAAMVVGFLWARSSLRDVDSCMPTAGVPPWSAASEAAAFAAIPSSLRHPAAGTAQYQDQYTIVLNSYRRPELLAASLRHYRNCEQVDAIRVVWSEGEPTPPGYSIPLPQTRSREDRRVGPDGVATLAAPVVYDVQPDASLNNRFRPLAGLRTEAVLSIDDDVLVPCAEVQVRHCWRLEP